MKTRIHFEVLNLSKMVLNYRKNLYYYSRLNFILQNAVMGTKYRSGFHSIFDLRINLDMISQVPVGGPLSMGDRTARRTISPSGPAWARIVIRPSDAMPARA